MIYYRYFNSIYNTVFMTDTVNVYALIHLYSYFYFLNTRLKYRILFSQIIKPYMSYS